MKTYIPTAARQVVVCMLIFLVAHAVTGTELIVETPGFDSSKPPKPVPLKLGDTLTIKATGGEAKAILAELNKVAANRKLTLYLNNIEIPGLQSSYEVSEKTASDLAALAAAEPAAKAGAQAKLDKDAEVKVHFLVERKSDVEGSRKAWDAIFRPLRTYEPNFEVALAVGSQSPVPVVGPDNASTIAFHASEWITPGVGIGFACFLFCGLILWRHNNMLRDGGDPAQAFSLGRVQMAFWGVVVLSCFVGVAVASFSLEHIPDQTLMLLGISAATGLSATIIGSKQASTPASTAKGLYGFFEDICVGDQGASFQRVQVVLWTLVLGVYFVWSVTKTMSMPEFSNSLLVLMGISNGTYLGFKTQEK